MPRAYSQDLRERVVAFVDCGHSRRAAAAHFDVSPSFVINLMTAYRARGSLAPKRLGGRRPAKLAPHRVFLLRRVAEKDDITMPELAGELEAECGTRADPASISRWLIRNGYRFKKTLLASECDRPDIRQAREEWRTERQTGRALEAQRLVFLDETGTTTKMTRLRGRCLNGRRLRSKAPFGHWKTQTFVAGLRCGALTAPFVIDAPMDRRIFETYVETQLVPTLEKGDIVIMDNLPAHKSPIAEKAILDRGRTGSVPAALQPRSQPDRDGLLKTQGSSARQGCPNHRRTLESHRSNLRPVPTRRVQKLLHRRRIRIHVTLRRSRSLCCRRGECQTC